MNDVDLAHPVPDEDIEEYHARGPSLLQQHADRLTRLNTLSLRLNYSQAVVILMLAGAIAVMIPLQKIIPLFISTDSAVETIRDISELPPDKQDDVVKSVLWTIVKTRQAYHFHGAKVAYDTVTALTTGKAQAEYQYWFRNDPTSPQYTLGIHGDRYVEAVPNSADIKGSLGVCRAAEWCEASLSYWQFEQLTGQAATKRQHYTAYLSFVFVDHLDPGERTTINPAGIKIIDAHFDCDDCGG
jgi:type IV secretory pathway component VirB8